MNLTERVGYVTGFGLGALNWLFRKRLRIVVAATLVGLLWLTKLASLSPAPGAWSYGKLGISNGTQESAVFFVEVGGLRHLPTLTHRPTLAYVVRCPDRTTAPKNFLDVYNAVSGQFQNHTRVMDYGRSDCLLLVGRKPGETIPITLDAVTARQWFGWPGTNLTDYARCEKFWDEVVSPRIDEFDRDQQATLDPKRAGL